MDSNLLLASDALDRGNGARALEHLERVTNFDDPEVFHLRASALIVEDRFLEAEQSALRGLNLAPDHLMLQLELARALALQNNDSAAEEALIRILNNDPECLPALTQYAWLLANAGDAMGARAIMDRIPGPMLSGVPSNLALQGYVALIEGRRRDAKQFLDRGMALDPENVSTRMFAALQGALNNKPNEVVDNMMAAAQLDPTFAGDEGREARFLKHPLMWPIRLIERIGSAKLWIGVMIIGFFGRPYLPESVLLVVIFGYLALAVYSWTLPFLLRRWLIWRGQL